MCNLQTPRPPCARPHRPPTSCALSATPPHALQEFLSCPEQDKLPAAPMGGGSVAARFVGDVTWGPSAAPVLSSVNFTAHRGELVAIVGATGSGKTALLYGLLGLTDHVHGNRIVVKGSTAFVAQQAFIFGGAAGLLRA